MRFTKYIVLLFFLIPHWAFSQLHLGIRGGYSISSIEFTPYQKERSLFDRVFDGGLVVKYFDLEYFGFQGELNFTQRGYRLPIDEDILKKRINTYIETPIFMQIRFRQKGFFTHFNVGFYASWLLKSAEGDNSSGAYDLSNYEFSLIKDNRVDYGLVGGLALGYDSKWGTLQVEARFFYGLGDLYYYNYDGNPIRSPARVQNLSLTYLYNISSIRKSKKNPIDKLMRMNDPFDNINQE